MRGKPKKGEGKNRTRADELDMSRTRTEYDTTVQDSSITKTDQDQKKSGIREGKDSRRTGLEQEGQ
jgi:hypothetical protein